MKCDECGEHSYNVGIVKNDDGEYINGCVKCYPIKKIIENKTINRRSISSDLNLEDYKKFRQYCYDNDITISAQLRKLVIAFLKNLNERSK